MAHAKIGRPIHDLFGFHVCQRIVRGVAPFKWRRRAKTIGHHGIVLQQILLDIKLGPALRPAAEHRQRAGALAGFRQAGNEPSHIKAAAAKLDTPNRVATVVVALRRGEISL